MLYQIFDLSFNFIKNNNSNGREQTMRKSIRHSDHHLCNDLEKIINKLCETRDSIQDAVGDAKDSAENALFESVEELKEKGSEMQEGTIDYIKENPLKSIVVALLAGMIISRFIRK